LVLESGEVYIWGSGNEGQLGLGRDVVKQNQPAILPMDDKVVQVACGYYHTMLVTGMLQVHSVYADVTIYSYLLLLMTDS